MTLVVNSDEKASRSSVYDTEFLASKSNGRGVDDRHHLLDVFAEQAEEESLVSFLINNDSNNNVFFFAFFL